MIFRYMKRYILFAVLASLFMVGEVSMDLLQPRLMEKIVDQGILGLNESGAASLMLIRSTSILMLLIVVIGGTCGILSGVSTNVFAQNCANDIRKDCFSRIMHFSFQQTDAFTSGSLITRTTSDVTQVQNMAAQTVRGLTRCLIFLLGGSFALISLDLRYMTVLAIAVPLILLDIIFLMHRTNPMFLRLQNKLDIMNSIMEENVRGVRVVKAFVQEEREKKRFDVSNESLVETQMKVLVTLAWMTPVINIILNLATVAVIRLGGFEVQAGNLQPGAVVAAVTYLTQILNAMNMLAMLFQTFSRGRASEKRLQEVLQTEPVIRDPEGTENRTGAEAEEMRQTACRTSIKAERSMTKSEVAGGADTDAPEAQGKGSVTFSHVSFHYPGREEPVLTDVNLDVRPGEMLVLIGSTGSGKSSLVNLIPRFYDVTGGFVKVDGKDVRDFRQKDLRKAVSIVLQKSELFSTTIRDNIAMGNRDASEEEIRRAAQAAQAEDFILNQPDGYDTPVAEQGMSLSGGQRQRIAIARGLVHGGEILILDDATSALDLRTEARLHAAVRKQYGSLTRIVIAQRVATAMQADRIAVLDKGTIIAVGTHEELLESCAVYQDICRSQLPEEAL